MGHSCRYAPRSRNTPPTPPLSLQASTCGPYDDDVREMMASMQASMPDPPGIVKVVITAAGKVAQGRAQVQVEVDAEGKVARIPRIVEVEVD